MPRRAGPGQHRGEAYTVTPGDWPSLGFNLLRIQRRLDALEALRSLGQSGGLSVSVNAARTWSALPEHFHNLSDGSGNRLGGTSHHTMVEADGTLRFVGDATVWKDIKFPQAPPKTVGAGNPTLVTWNGNLRGFAYAIGAAHDFDSQEVDHDAREGSTATWHLHWVSRANDGTDRTVQWDIEWTLEPDSGAYAAPSSASVEVTIPAGTPANTPMRTDITTFALGEIARQAWVRLSRSAGTGTAPSVDPVVAGMHFHYEIDTVGSRDITTK